MKWRVDVRAGVRDHVDPSDLEGRPVVEILRCGFAFPEIADVRTWQALEGRHSMFDHMAEVDDPFLFHSRHNATAAISIQTTLSEADGSARCAQPLTTKPAAPNKFIHWNASD